MGGKLAQVLGKVYGEACDLVGHSFRTLEAVPEAVVSHEPSPPPFGVPPLGGWASADGRAM